ncbi:hypothetical protein B0H14DRAFT_2587662 [Mycena olivaceomarginata]|nr:hypothetical protein B0H14DRAFT_2587662 [Mycena olivaceomarginata]
MPQGMVDLTKGEGYAYTDYALAYALADAELIRWIRLGYDIWCQYGVRLVARFARWFPSMSAIIAKLEGAINKLHILNHKELCQIIHNLNWLLTREMNDGHRHDVIDGTSDHWNWEKTIKLCEPEVCCWLKKLRPNNRRTRAGPGGDQGCRYDKCGPDDGKSPVRTGNTSGWHTLIKWDRERIKRMRASPATPADVLAAARQQLESDIKALRKWQLDRVPELHRYMSEMDGGEPEKMRLLLPSDFSPADRARLELSGLATAEYGLHEGQAHDALADLRTAIRTKNLQSEFEEDGHLRALGLPKGDATLQPLSRNEQWGKGGVALKVIRSKDREPWFWAAQRPAGLDAKAEADWEEEMDRVQWFRERALMKRANEEVEILEVEFERSIRWFLKNSENWTTMAERERRADYVDNQGWRAYAHKQAIIYADLARECETLRKKLPQLVMEDEIADAKKAKKDEEERELDAMEEPDYEINRRNRLAGLNADRGLGDLIGALGDLIGPFDELIGVFELNRGAGLNADRRLNRGLGGFNRAI